MANAGFADLIASGYRTGLFGCCQLAMRVAALCGIVHTSTERLVTIRAPAVGNRLVANDIGSATMLIRQMTSSECRAELGRFRVGRLAFVHNGMPQVVPMRFAYDGSDLYGFSMLGEKIVCMRESPHVCVEFDDQANHFQWRSVVLTGRYEELADSPENIKARRHAQDVLQKLAMWWQPATAAMEARNEFVPIFFCIRVNKMTGHEARPDPVEAAVLSNSASADARSGAIRRFLSEVVHSTRKGAERPKH